MKDFNLQGKEPPIVIQDQRYDQWEETIIDIKIPFLAVSKNEIVIMTWEPDPHGWLEGYKANDPKREVGIIHKDFINLFSFKRAM